MEEIEWEGGDRVVVVDLNVRGMESDDEPKRPYGIRGLELGMIGTVAMFRAQPDSDGDLYVNFDDIGTGMPGVFIPEAAVLKLEVPDLTNTEEVSAWLEA